MNYTLSNSTNPAFHNAVVNRTTLDNGLEIVTLQRPVNTLLVAAVVKVGSSYEADDESGISHFLEHMAFKGTKSRSVLELSTQVERIGADINAMTSQDMTAYMVKGLAGHMDIALDILSDVLINSTLPEDEIAREKDVVVQEINGYADDVQTVAFDSLMEMAFPDQALGRSILGTEDSVRSITRDGLAGYMSDHYNSSNMVVVGVGNIDHEQFVKDTSARFADLAPGAVAAPCPSHYQGGEIVKVLDYTEQTHAFIAFPAPAQNDPAFARYDLLSDVLGSGMSSPLFNEVREKRGLCYGVGAGMMPHYDMSLFMINGATSPENVKEFLTIASGELAKIANGQLADVDFERARNQIVTQLVLRSERNTSAMMNTVHDIFYRDHIRTLDEIVATYMAVTKEDLITTAKAMITTQPTVAVIGNVSDEESYIGLVQAALVGG